jgi:5'-nucleotidase
VPTSSTARTARITYADAFAVQPFSNDVVTQTLTGAQIKQALEEQWQPDGASRPVLHLGVSKGLTYSYDEQQPRVSGSSRSR